jgi:exonuclease III
MLNVPPDYNGRPYGGVALICKDNPNFSFSEINTFNDRIVAPLIKDSASDILQTIINVYMPFYQSGNHEQTNIFVETVDALQVLIDNYQITAPYHQ